MARGLNCATIGIVFVVCGGAAVDIDLSDYIALKIRDVIINRIIIRGSIPLSHCNGSTVGGVHIIFLLPSRAEGLD